MEHHLKTILSIYNKSLNQIAQELSITRQTVNEWVGKRQKPIPEKQIKKLSVILNIDEDILRGKQKLNEKELLKIYQMKIEQHMGKSVTIIAHEK